MSEGCKSWRGHKFEARYDTEPVIYESERYGDSAFSDTASKKTYVHDICVRCGQVVQRPTNTPEK